MKNHILAVGFLLSMLILTGCSDLQPAQDYVVTGTLSLPEQLKTQFEEYNRLGAGFELVMTARSGPKTKDILIQRRWLHVEMPFEFGLGKGRAAILKKKTDSVYVTASLTCTSENFSFAVCGFTAKKVPIGTYHIKLALDGDPNADSTYLRPGAPIGGWSSPSAIEEARPPSADDKPLGAMAFAGEILVPNDLNRAFKGWNLRIMAREREARGAPELILPIPSPTFPLSFSLHQNQRIMGGTDPILDPKFVVIILDKDGVNETEDDRIIVSTAERVAVGSDELLFRFPGKELRALLKAVNGGGATSRSATSRADSQPTKSAGPAEKGALVAEGVISLPTDLAAEATGAALWVSIRDAQSNKPLMFHRAPKVTFPYEFAIHNGEGEMGMTVPLGTNIVVKGILTKSGDPTDKQALVGFSSATQMGAKGLKIELKRP